MVPPDPKSQEGCSVTPIGAILAGVATSGYQSEGGYNGHGQPRNNWAGFEESGRVTRSGRAVDFWNRYELDFRLCQNIGLNAFRLSLEWARIQPSSQDLVQCAPDIDTQALDDYAVRIAACRAAGLEPVVTLHHFTHPAWLGTDPWLDDRTPGLFESFTKAAVERVNERLVTVHGTSPIQWYVTINEPNMLVLNTYMSRHFPGGRPVGISVGVRAYNRLLAAHVRAYNAIHDLHASRGWPLPKVSMNTFCSDVYWSENMLLDLLGLREHGIREQELGGYFRARSHQLRAALSRADLACRTDLWAWFGRGLHRMADVFASRAATARAFAYFLDELRRSKRECVLDYIGLDYYDPFLGHILRPPAFSDIEFRSGSLHGHVMDGLSSKWWDWHVLPGGLSAFARHYSESFGGRGVLVAENGMALRCKMDNSACGHRKDRVTRSEFLRAHFQEVVKLRSQGVPMLGYLHWSLTDNYEWGSFTPRFGLFRIDYANDLRRLTADQLGDTPSLTYAQLLREFRTAE